MITKHPGLYADLGKKASDLLTKEFPDKTKFEVKTKTASGLNFEASMTRNADGSIFGLVNPKYKFASHGVEASLSLDTKRNSKLEVSATDFLPGLKSTVTASSDSESVKLDMEYKHEYLTFGTSLDFLGPKGNTLNASGVIGLDGLALGLQAEYLYAGADNSKFTSASGVASYSGNDFVASVLTRNKGDIIGGTFYQKINSRAAVGAELTVDVKKQAESPVFTIGGAYDLDADTTVKGKFNTEGKISFSWAQRVHKHVRVVLGSQINTNNLSGSGNHSIGLTFSFND